MHKLSIFAAACLASFAVSADADAVLTFAGNAQHTAVYQPAAQDLNRVHWSTTIDQNPGALAHYGAPLLTAANTAIVPVKTSSNGFQVNVFNGATGTPLYTLTTDYILPSYTWVPVYQPVVATGTFGTRLYYAGVGGTIYSIDNPDSAGHGAPVQTVFYTTLGNYQANAVAFNSTVFINTPITADPSGNIFFGFRVQGTAPAPLNTTQSGFARIEPNGNATYVLAETAANDSNIARDTHNSAPALSNDGTTVYVPVKSASTEYYGYLLGLDATTLATKCRVFLKDPRNGNPAGILDISTASPTVAPDGDVYFGIMSNPDNGSRGFLLRFSADLSIEKTPGGFGWDYTAAIVPASMVPLYTGSSAYLIFSKYNNYANTGDGNGVNRIALLDPNVTQIDPHPSANGLAEMREVLTAIGPTPDSENPSIPNAVREWCINTAAVNPATNSVFTPSEDGHIYRWNLATNSLSQAATLSAGVGEPYVPSVIGPDGTVYTLNGGTLFALGGLMNESIESFSSAPDLRNYVTGQTVTFTVAVANTGGLGLTPTGTIAFQDTVYTTSSSTTTVLSSVPLDATGQAAFSTSSLAAAHHFINALYSGDSNFGAGSIMLVQNVHAFGSATTVSSTPNPSSPGRSATFTATVTTVPLSSNIPTGMVTFQEASTVLAQSALGSSGTVSFSTSSLSTGSHTITAVYASDSLSATSGGFDTQIVQTGSSTSTTLNSSPNPSVFGQSVTFTAAVTSGVGTLTGTVTFTDGANVLASTLAVDGTGHASFSTAALSVATHTITASFTGTNGWLNSSGTDSSSPQIVDKDASTTKVTSSATTIVLGQPVTFTATVTANAPGSGTPTSTVIFKDGSTTLAMQTLDATGHASFTTAALAIGSHSITVVYGGDGDFTGSTSTSITETVNRDATTTTVISSADPATTKTAVTFTAAVSVTAPGSGTPSGTVTFRDKNTVLATGPVDGTGHSTFTTSSLAQGAHQITVSYSGSANYAPSTSMTLGENIKK